MELNRYSKTITQKKSQGASQAMLLGTGLTREDLDKAQVGIGSVWYEGNTCNMHLLDLATKIKKSVNAQGLLGLQFNTIGVSDGISMGTDGMSYSLQSRDLIADSIETVMSAQWYDGLVTVPGCDKNMPGCLMAMARLNRPAIMLYGGTIAAGCLRSGEGKLDIVSAFQTYGQYLTGEITEEQRQEIVARSCPGAGACGGMYTANTMASAIETLGMSLPYSSSAPAISGEKQSECDLIGLSILNLLKLDLKPCDIMTAESFRNALVVIIALGGSTNAVLHMLAIAHAAGVDLTLDDIQDVSDKTPFIADLKPSGQYVMADLHAAGGLPAVQKLLLRQGLITGDQLTVTGKTLAENLEELPNLQADQKIIVSFDNPVKQSGHLQILHGNLAPDGSVAKITGKEGLQFSGPANVFDSEEQMLTALEDKQIAKGEVVVIRYEGPKGGPGMPEMLSPTAGIVGAGLANDVALITDGRFSGGSHGFIIGHVTPEAQEGGPIALLRNGDLISIDAENNTINVELSEQEMATRRAAWQMPEYKATRGTLYKYIKTVSSAEFGCITDG